MSPLTLSSPKGDANAGSEGRRRLPLRIPGPPRPVAITRGAGRDATWAWGAAGRAAPPTVPARRGGGRAGHPGPRGPGCKPRPPRPARPHRVARSPGWRAWGPIETPAALGRAPLGLAAPGGVASPQTRWRGGRSEQRAQTHGGAGGERRSPGWRLRFRVPSCGGSDRGCGDPGRRWNESLQPYFLNFIIIIIIFWRLCAFKGSFPETDTRKHSPGACRAGGVAGPGGGPLARHGDICHG